jgi:hypothetical protein
MTPEAAEALEGSIKKWRAIVDGTGKDGGATNCPLCQLFEPNGENACHGCPVEEATGLAGCRGTPYEEWSDYEPDEGGHTGAILDKYAGGYYAAPPEARRLAQAELDFLVSLRSPRGP